MLTINKIRLPIPIRCLGAENARKHFLDLHPTLFPLQREKMEAMEMMEIVMMMTTMILIYTIPSTILLKKGWTIAGFLIGLLDARRRGDLYPVDRRVIPRTISCPSRKRYGETI